MEYKKYLIGVWLMVGALSLQGAEVPGAAGAGLDAAAAGAKAGGAGRDDAQIMERLRLFKKAKEKYDKISDVQEKNLARNKAVLELLQLSRVADPSEGELGKWRELAGAVRRFTINLYKEMVPEEMRRVYNLYPEKTTDDEIKRKKAEQLAGGTAQEKAFFAHILSEYGIPRADGQEYKSDLLTEVRNAVEDILAEKHPVSPSVFSEPIKPEDLQTEFASRQKRQKEMRDAADGDTNVRGALNSSWRKMPLQDRLYTLTDVGLPRWQVKKEQVSPAQSGAAPAPAAAKKEKKKPEYELIAEPPHSLYTKYSNRGDAHGLNLALLGDAVDLATMTSTKAGVLGAGIGLSAAGRLADSVGGQHPVYTPATHEEDETVARFAKAGKGLKDVSAENSFEHARQVQEDKVAYPRAAHQVAKGDLVGNLATFQQRLAQPGLTLLEHGMRAFNFNTILAFNRYLAANKHKPEVKKYLKSLRNKRIALGVMLGLESALKAGSWWQHARRASFPRNGAADADDATRIERGNMLTAGAVLLNLVRQGYSAYVKHGHTSKAQEHEESTMFEGMTPGHKEQKPSLTE